MKLVIITSVEEFEKDIIKLFKEAEIESFSGLDIDGYKNTIKEEANSSWFPSIKGGNESHMFFSFTDEVKIDALFNLIIQFNKKITTNNPIRAIVLPIEKHI